MLNPNPLAIMTEIDDYDPESYQSATYIPTLANVIRDKLNLGGRVMLQFDTALEEAEY